MLLILQAAILLVLLVQSIESSIHSGEETAGEWLF